ncbi:MAG TPA: SOS response-associated peptidase, partial [Lacunisphaera sp.]|nr:SOS response-associated peptidase [Lacunisphaera sp.]
MCTRYALSDLKAIATLVEAANLGVNVDLIGTEPRFNVALTQRVPVITKHSLAKLETLSFGLLLPARAPAQKPLLLANARAETLLTKHSFLDAAQHRRCLVPATGFYEWERLGSTRLPHYFTLTASPAFFFAGLWEPETATAPAAFAIVTTAPNPLLGAIHDRMPVILGPNSGPAWLGDEPLPPARLAQLCRPFAAERMAGRRVDPRVNNVRYEAPDCIA